MSSLDVDYKSWGLGNGRLLSQKLTLTEKEIKKAKKIVMPFLQKPTFYLKRVQLVNYYQGPHVVDKELAFLRFEKNDNAIEILGGEHVSFLIDLSLQRIIGLTKMWYDSSNEDFISHQQALNKAVAFLCSVAPDLIPSEINLPMLPVKSSGTKLDLVHKIKVGNIELHWIGSHIETIVVENRKIEIKGMKVKLYHQPTNLWTWVVIDNKGEIITFERNVFWNFEKFKRGTQMWLHDNWLLAQNLSLKPTSVETLKRI